MIRIVSRMILVTVLVDERRFNFQNQRYCVGTINSNPIRQRDQYSIVVPPPVPIHLLPSLVQIIRSRKPISTHRTIITLRLHLKPSLLLPPLQVVSHPPGPRSQIKIFQTSRILMGPRGLPSPHSLAITTIIPRGET